MLNIFGVYRYDYRAVAVLGLLGIYRMKTYAHIVNGVHNIDYYTLAVYCIKLKRGNKALFADIIPVRRNPSFRFCRLRNINGNIVTIALVNGNSVTAGYKSYNLVPGKRRSAP